MKPSPKDLEPVQIQVPKEIVISQLMVAKDYIRNVFGQMQPLFFVAFEMIMNDIDHAIDAVNKHYEPAEPDPEEVAKLNRNVAKIQQWAKD